MFAVSLIVLTFAVVAWLVTERQRSVSAKRAFGRAYEMPVPGLGVQLDAGVPSTARKQRLARPDVLPLSAPEATSLSLRWTTLQSRFVDDPRAAVADAQRLVRELLERRNYLQAEGDRPASDEPPDHPAVVTTYIAAQAITARLEHGQADTEVLRTALVYYRTLFEELLEVEPN